MLAMLRRWFARHDARVLEALSSGPKTGKALKAAGVLSPWNCYSVLHSMEEHGLIESEVQDPEYGVRRVYRRKSDVR